MKKIIGIVLLIAGFMATSVGALMLHSIKSSSQNVSIIGGADGPTTIFLAGKIGYPMFGSIVSGILLLVIGLILLFTKKNNMR